MHRPLRVPLYLRVWQLVRGLFFYNTVYWKKASDELNLPSMSLEEREKLRPPRDLEFIRPRENPRARMERGAEVSVASPRIEPRIAAPVEAAPVEPAPSEAISPDEETVEDDIPKVIIKRKRYRRKHFHGSSSGGGWFRRGSDKK